MSDVHDDDYEPNPLLRLAGQVSAATPAWGEQALAEIEAEVSQALGVTVPGRWLRSVPDAMALTALSPDGGGPIKHFDGSERGSVKAALANRAGDIFAPGSSGYSEGGPQAIVCSVLRREARRRAIAEDLEQDQSGNTASPKRYDDLIEEGRKAWDILHLKAIRDPKLDAVTKIVDRLTWALQVAQARAVSAEAATDRLLADRARVLTLAGPEVAVTAAAPLIEPTDLMRTIAAAVPDGLSDEQKLAQVEAWLEAAAAWPAPSRDDLRGQFLSALQSHQASGERKPEDVDLMVSYARFCCDGLKLPYTVSAPPSVADPGTPGTAPDAAPVGPSR